MKRGLWYIQKECSWYWEEKDLDEDVGIHNMNECFNRGSWVSLLLLMEVKSPMIFNDTLGLLTLYCNDYLWWFQFLETERRVSDRLEKRINFFNQSKPFLFTLKIIIHFLGSEKTIFIYFYHNLIFFHIFVLSSISFLSLCWHVFIHFCWWQKGEKSWDYLKRIKLFF